MPLDESEPSALDEDVLHARGEILFPNPSRTTSTNPVTLTLCLRLFIFLRRYLQSVQDIGIPIDWPIKTCQGYLGRGRAASGEEYR